MSEPLASEVEGEPEELDRMTLLEHLDELRGRIVRSLIAMFVGFLLCFSFARQIYAFLQAPVDDLVDKLVFTNMTTPFFVYIKVSLVAAIFLVSPYLLYQIWSYVAPGLYRKEKRYALPFIFFGSTFFMLGGLFGFYVAFPFAANFLIGVGEDFEAMITVDSYLNLLINILLGLGVMFQLPIVIFMLSQIGIVTPKFLIKNFRWAVLIIFIVAAIITPTPDVINLCIVAVPTIGLYLLGVGAAALAGRKKKT